MRVSLAWLNEWVETGWDAATAAARLTMGQEIAADLKKDGVDGVLLVAT